MTITLVRGTCPSSFIRSVTSRRHRNLSIYQNKSEYAIFFFLKRQNIINQQARARSTNKLRWRKKYEEGEIGCLANSGSNKNRFKKPLLKHKYNTKRVKTQAYTSERPHAHQERKTNQKASAHQDLPHHEWRTSNSPP